MLPRPARKDEIGAFDQRPPFAVAEDNLRSLLAQAMSMAYVTGSVGGSYTGEDDVFEYKVSFTITRKDRSSEAHFPIGKKG